MKEIQINRNEMKCVVPPVIGTGMILYGKVPVEVNIAYPMPNTGINNDKL